MTTKSSTAGLDYATVDVFTTTRFGGNPLAIILLPPSHTPSQQEKQAIAREFNYSETVFLHTSSSASEKSEWRFDIFTTDQELPFAGHPTIGTAWWLKQMHPELTRARLLAKAGAIGITYDTDEGGMVYATADIPHNVHVHQGMLAREDLLTMQPKLGEYREQLTVQGAPVVSIVKDMTFAYVEVGSMEMLRAVQVTSYETRGFLRLDEEWESALCATYFYYVDEGKSGEARYKLNCRMIESFVGEDAATGSGSSGLAAFLAMELAKKKKVPADRSVKFEIDQGVEMGRPSKITIEVLLTADGKIDKIYQGGSAVHIMSGRLM